ncbi:hypothetical protein ACIRU8_14985 [Streptomyces sp. NPDC101175]|uniref:hypothetical protein n=1 Tax=Streptomyces sp. NPDC101175 TaxID=3366123 RepID=UPI0038332BE5
MTPTDLSSFIIFASVVLLLAIAKRTRPLIVAFSALWVLGSAVYYIAHDETSSAIGLLIVAAGITFGAIRDRKKLMAQLKG